MFRSENSVETEIESREEAKRVSTLLRKGSLVNEAVQRIRGMIERERWLEEKTDEEAIRADFAFHQKLIEISGNELMLNVIRVLQEFFLAAMARTTRRPRDRDVSRPLHQSILEGVRVRSPEAAEKAMQAHMEITRARLESYAVAVPPAESTL